MATLTGRSGTIMSARISRALVLAAVLILVLGFLIMMGLLLGTPQLVPADLITLPRRRARRLEQIVVPGLRLPRVLIGTMAGAMLALAGDAAARRDANALAGPELLGVSAGASVVIAAVTIFHLTAAAGTSTPWRR